MRRRGSIVSDIQKRLHCRRIDLIHFLKVNNLGGSLIKSFRARQFAEEVGALAKAGYSTEEIAQELGISKASLSQKAAQYNVKLSQSR